MLFSYIDHISLESFQQHAGGHSLVFLDPFTHHRTLLLRRFLERREPGLLYHSVPRPGLNVRTWLPLLTAEIRRVYPEFGAALDEKRDTTDAVALGAALARDLSAVCQPSGLLIIDDIERLHDPDLERFLRALLSGLPAGVHVVLSSMLIDRQPWSDLLARRQAVVLRAQERLHELRFVRCERPAARLEVYALDEARIVLNGQPIERWEGVLPRLLFFYLIDHPLVMRDRVVADIWPALPLDEATDIFHVTKHKITDLLGRVTRDAQELTQYLHGYYMPGSRVIRMYDVHEFEDLIDRALHTTDQLEAELLLRRALDYYRTAFLSGLDAPWVQRRREELALRFGEALIRLGEIVDGQGDQQTALDLLERGLSLRPEREDAHRRLIELLLRRGQSEAARSRYERMLTQVYQPLGLQPSKETLELRARLEASSP
jgi:two-component SAPR family response regulator